MGLTSVLIIVGLIVGSGLIAFFGDWFGTKLGKARVSIFGLRPRRTANLITVLTGVVIAGLTLGLLVLVSEGVRTRLLEMEKLIRQQAELREMTRTMKVQLDDIESRNRVLTGLRDSLLSRIAVLQHDLASTRDERARAEKAIARLRAERRKAESELAAARARLHEMEAELRRNEMLVQEMQSELDSAVEQLAGVKDQIAENKATIETQERVISNQLEVIRTNDQELRAKDEELRAKTQELDAKEAELRALEQRLLTTEVGSITGVIELRKSGVTYRRGEEVARAVVDGTGSKDEIATVIRALLKRAGDAARERGAEPGDGTRAIEVIAGKIITGGVEKPFTAEDKIAAVVDEIWRSEHSTAVLIVAAFNAFEGEPVKVDFELYWNQFTFDKGEKLAEAQIDGTKAKDRIFSDLMAFVSGQVRDKAKLRGIIPQNGQYVEVSYEELIDAMDKISASRRVRQVGAISGTACWAADQVTVRLEVR
jgi:uncharacterized protein (DUF3084 family)